MKKVDECVACASKQIINFKAFISPFIAERIWGNNISDINLSWCKNCDFAFYNPRLEENEARVLYKNYRDKDYQQQRYKHEPYYTSKINDLIGNNETEIANRKANLFRILNKNIDISEIKNILDFGGDKGQFIIDEADDANKFVFEISGVEPLDNIIKINNYNECKKHSYDLIMCCHVLEHVPYPSEIVQNIKELSNKNTVLYIEVPLEFPFVYDNLSRFKKIIRSISFLNPFLPNQEEAFNKGKALLIDNQDDLKNSGYINKIFYDIPKYINKILSLSRFYMNEHINFFTPKSLEKILELNGFDNISTEIKEIDCGWINYKARCCLAKISNK